MLLGLDFSEHSVAVIVADDDGATLVALRAELPRSGSSSQWLAAMQTARQAMLQTHAIASQITRICLAFYAPLDENGVVQKDARAPGWSSYDLPSALREHLEVENVMAVPRVLCEAIAEERLGALRPLANASGAPIPGTPFSGADWLYLHLGVSVEACARSNGILVRGANSSAVEVGAICIERGGALSDSGKRGSVNGYCGGDAFITRARSYGLTTSTPHEIWEVAPTNAMAKSLCDDYTERLAQGLGAALAMLNPARLTIGGEFGHELGTGFLAPLRARLGEYCLSRHVENLEISIGQLGRDAAVLGAVSLARDELK
jgi:predicted NBD/HSP70 family sugar kinase